MHADAAPDEPHLLEIIAGLTTLRAGVTLGIGDDAAIIATSPPTVVTQDLLVDGVHFRRATASPGDIGHKALAVNLSDLAAMGADPVAAFVGLGLPDESPLSGADVAEMYRAMEHLAATFDLTIAGGDIVRAPALTLAVTAVGRMSAVDPVRRSGARPGDAIFVTGVLGAAAAGLWLLDHPEDGPRVPAAGAVRAASLRPTPRLAAGAVLAGAGATAMMDCSDGLLLDLQRLAVASGVRMAVELAQLPLAGGVTQVAALAGREPDVFAATGGDDYELIVTLPPATAAGVAGRLDVPLTRVGTVTAGSPGLEVTRDGARVEVGVLGWEHRPGTAHPHAPG